MNCFLQELPGQNIEFDVTETRMVVEIEVALDEEQGPLCLAGVQSLSSSDVF